MKDIRSPARYISKLRLGRTYTDRKSDKVPSSVMSNMRFRTAANPSTGLGGTLKRFAGATLFLYSVILPRSALGIRLTYSR